MAHHPGSPIPDADLRPDLWVADIVYRPDRHGAAAGRPGGRRTHPRRRRHERCSRRSRPSSTSPARRPTSTRCWRDSAELLSVRPLTPDHRRQDGRVAADSLGAQLPLWSAAPFVGLLVASRSSNCSPHGGGTASPTRRSSSPARRSLAAAHLLGGFGSAGGRHAVHSMTDYVSFIVLLTRPVRRSPAASRSGGRWRARRWRTWACSRIGAVLANLIGTTGASMVLIRPFLRANAQRRRKAHLVVFFILIVANTGGLLTPLGDPPLYLGLPQGRAVRVDVQPLAAVVVCQRRRARPVQPGRPVRRSTARSGPSRTRACWTSCWCTSRCASWARATSSSSPASSR